MNEVITIAGQQFNVPSPFTEGHTCTAGEASALNQLLHENGRNNLSKRAKAGELTQGDVDQYFSSYAFGVRVAGASGPRVSRDPVAARAMKIAKGKVIAGLRAQGKNPSDYKAAAINEAAAKALDKHPEWKELAARQIEEEAALGIVDEEVEAPEAPAEGEGEAPKRGRRKAA